MVGKRDLGLLQLEFRAVDNRKRIVHVGLRADFPVLELFGACESALRFDELRPRDAYRQFGFTRFEPHDRLSLLDAIPAAHKDMLDLAGLVRIEHDRLTGAPGPDRADDGIVPGRSDLRHHDGNTFLRARPAGFFRLLRAGDAGDDGADIVAPDPKGGRAAKQDDEHRELNPAGRRDRLRFLGFSGFRRTALGRHKFSIPFAGRQRPSRRQSD